MTTEDRLARAEHKLKELELKLDILQKKTRDTILDQWLKAKQDNPYKGVGSPLDLDIKYKTDIL